MTEKKTTSGSSATVTNLSEAYQETPYLNPESLPDSLLTRMPQPTGWRILILPYRGAGKTESGILLSHETQERSNV